MSEKSTISQPFATTGRSRKGEPWVWLTAAGLTFGVLMALGLFILICVKGVASFWPQRIELLEIKGDTTRQIAAGILSQERLRKDAQGVEHEELQFFHGNRDLQAEAFRYYDRSQIVRSTQPQEMWWVERSENGTAFIFPKQVESDGKTIQAGDPAFEPTLDRVLKKGREVRSRLRQIERKEIGAISREMEALNRAERSREVAPGLAAERRATLQQEFERLQKETAEMREELAKSRLLGSSADGREMVFPVETLLNYFPSNRAGFFERVAEMVRRMSNFLTEDPRQANTEGGVFPAIFGTVIMTLVMSLMVTPFGVIAAIYLREYATQGMLVQLVRICVNNLAGVPSIVFGVFGLAFFVYFVGGGLDQWLFADKLPTPTYGTPGILWASLTLALLTLPVIIVATEEALSAVPRGVREAALACGASKWQMIQRVVLPASMPGILTGVILAMARGAGEVAPLMLVGVVKLAPSLPVDGIAPFIHPERKFMHLGFHIYDLGFQSPDAEAAKPAVFATAMLLIIIVVALNLTAILIRNRLKKRFAVSSF